mgnify:CR=1 FL=1
MKFVFWVVVLIALYLVAQNAGALNQLIGSLGDISLRGIATLQGRQKIKGVTQ